MSYYENALKMRPYMEKAAASLSDADALEVPTMFPAWAVETAYAVDERIEYVGTLYRCVQAHTSQAGWMPPTTPALWVVVSLEEWPEWVQPTGAHDAYNTGDRVTYNGKVYESTMDGNTWSTDAYPQGWEDLGEVTA